MGPIVPHQIPKANGPMYIRRFSSFRTIELLKLSLFNAVRESALTTRPHHKNTAAGSMYSFRLYGRRLSGFDNEFFSLAEHAVGNHGAVLTTETPPEMKSRGVDVIIRRKPSYSLTFRSLDHLGNALGLT